MPRSFLVKKHLTNKKPDYGVLESKKHEVMNTESSSTKLKPLHHEPTFPAPPHVFTAPSSSLRMNPINLGMYHPSLPMDSPALALPYPVPLRDMQPVLPTPEFTQSFQRFHRNPEDKVPLSQSEAGTASSVQERRDGCLDRHKSYFTFSSMSKQRKLHCEWQCQKYFSCKYCDKEYASLGALKMHIRTHTLPCVCKLCGKAFSRPWLLQGHIRTHTGEKPFSCPHCSRAFADRSNLRAHLQTHSEIKKYQCKNCFKTFSRISLLSKHEEAGCCPMS
ncbi:zinc finger protein SNAI3 [Paramisgurnus dabryanus]|uniref:zinc finger protein SNAI3 n=1 Tax=Paramisgurnus dabryanus TaxID=90735 RepID=UPI0031F37328